MGYQKTCGGSLNQDTTVERKLTPVLEPFHTFPSFGVTLQFLLSNEWKQFDLDLESVISFVLWVVCQFQV